MALATKKRVHRSKKRVGIHHKHTDHYLKHYWPYLPMLLVVGLGLLVNSFWPRQSAVLGSTTNLSSSSLLSRTNSERKKLHETNLALNTELSAAANNKAQDMINHNYWAHVAPDGTTPWTFINNAGYIYDQAGENLAYGLDSSDAVLNAWMHSQSHRENVLNTRYSEVGFGIANAPDYLGKGPKTIVVAMYATPAIDPSTIPATQSQPLGNAVLGDRETTRPVSRLAALNKTPISILPLLVAGLTGLAALTLFAKHGRSLHKSLVRGEAFIIHHPWLDLTLLALVVLGLVLGQNTGSIL